MPVHRLSSALGWLSLSLLLAACPTADDDDGGACDAEFGVLRVCLCWDEVDSEPVTDAAVMVRTELDDPYPIEALIGPDGCTEVALEPGTWEWSARDSGLHCVSPFESALVPRCAVEERKVALMQWCVVGGG